MSHRMALGVVTSACAIALLAGAAAGQTTWKVQLLNNTPLDDVEFQLIQQAIDDERVESGHTILVYGPGGSISTADPSQPYPELISLNGKSLTIRGEDPSGNGARIRIMPLASDLDPYPFQVVLIQGDDTAGTVLQNFSIETPTINVGGQDITPPVRGMYISDSSPQIINCVFKDLLATHGAGVLVDLETVTAPEIKGSLFTNCDTLDPPEAITDVFGGGAIFVDASDLIVDTTTIENCDAALAGGGMYIKGGSTVRVRESTFNTNTAGLGGGIYSEHTSEDSLGVVKTVFTLNAADTSGGAVALLGEGPGTLVSCDLEDNSANDMGGGVYHGYPVLDEPVGDPDFLAVCTVINSRLVGNSAETGAALAANHPRAATTFVLTTIADNTASEVIGAEGAAVFNLAHLTVENSIVYSNTPPGWVDNFAGLPVSFFSDLDGYVPNAGDIGCIDEPPVFMDLSTRDVRLAASSGCIDKGKDDRVPLDDYDIDGNNVTNEVLPIDLDGLLRFYSYGGDEVVDMGCYERQPPGPCNAADFAEPYGVLDLSDVALFVSAFVNRLPEGDLNDDGVHDLTDVSMFVDAFVTGCP